MGAPKKYTAKKLREKVEAYFASITRQRELTEPKATGYRDEKGHMIYEDVPILNSLGEPVMVTEYVVPPTVGDLSAFLGIHRDTWHDYCDREKHPEFSDTTTRARGRIHAYLEREVLTRSGKDLKGVLFNLENNFGYKEHLEVTSGTLEEYLKQLQEDTGEGQRF